MKSGNLNFLEPSGPLQACNGTASPLSFMYQHTDTKFWKNVCQVIFFILDTSGLEILQIWTRESYVIPCGRNLSWNSYLALKLLWIWQSSPVACIFVYDYIYQTKDFLVNIVAYIDAFVRLHFTITHIWRPVKRSLHVYSKSVKAGRFGN